jgi:DNA-binding transcriptional MerR regulator
VTLAVHSSEGRSYRSIREVLDLLTPEFPDVTISKIRFLESRGLIEPERTPSGYRKFFPADVDRLRWILKQQSEHFLPLKVIKGRLEQGALFEAELSAAEPSLFDAAIAAPEPTNEGSTNEPAEAKPAPKLGGGGDEPPTGPESAAGNSPAPVRPAAPITPAVEVPAVAPAAPETPAATPAAAVSEPATVPPVRERAPSVSRRASSDTAYSVAELIGATGATEELVEELVEFGLISARLVRGSQTFGSEALEVTRLAAGFAEFGIEPRHLKSVRFAAERQALVYSQIVAPLLRQRNGATRERATTDLANMAAMGAKLYEAFLHSVLHDLA